MSRKGTTKYFSWGHWLLKVTKIGLNMHVSQARLEEENTRRDEATLNTYLLQEQSVSQNSWGQKHQPEIKLKNIWRQKCLKGKGASIAIRLNIS